jgi:hypothetical protein
MHHRPQDVPLSLAVIANRHVHAILLDLAHAVQLPQDELDQLALAVLGHHGQAIDNDEGVEALVQAHLKFFFDIGKVDLGLVKFVILHGEVLVGRCHDCGGGDCQDGGVAVRFNFANNRQNSKVLPRPALVGMSRAARCLDV